MLLGGILSPKSALPLEDNPLVFSALLMVLALIPFLLLSLTAFVKISVVFSILRNALGAGQVPSAAISSLLSLILSLHIAMPIAKSALNEFDLSTEFDSIEVFLEKIEKAAKPFEDFLEKHCGQKEREFFATLAKSDTPKQGLTVLVPAFLITELREAFAIGFTIYLPFLVIDLVVANLLVGMGMMMVSPVTVSVPFKIGLFVLSDGWYLLCRGLVLGYQGVG